MVGHRRPAADGGAGVYPLVAQHFGSMCRPAAPRLQSGYDDEPVARAAGAARAPVDWRRLQVSVIASVRSLPVLRH